MLTWPQKRVSSKKIKMGYKNAEFLADCKFIDRGLKQRSEKSRNNFEKKVKNRYTQSSHSFLPIPFL